MTCAAEIEALGRYAAALQKRKRGLMQKLLTGQWRFTPHHAEGTSP
jgi:hypothetical protein